MNRTLPQIAQTHAKDVARHAALLALARGGAATDADIAELTEIDADLHRFSRMCARWMPISATDLGFMWGEILTHETPGSPTVIVRENGLVELEGETVTLWQATTRSAAKGLRMSLGGWRGSVGTVGDLAGLRNPSTIRPDGQTTESDDLDGGVPSVEKPESDQDLNVQIGGGEKALATEAAPEPTMPAKKPAKAPKAPKPSVNYDLFG